MFSVAGFSEVLESRTLMSASAASTALSAAVQADRTQIRVDLLKFKSDCFAADSTLLADVTALKVDGLKNAAAIHKLVKALRLDINHMHKMLKADRLDESSAVLADEATIIRDRAQYVADKGNLTARSADKVKLRADHVKVQTDMIAGLNARVTERQNDYTKIFSDGQAILTAIDSNATISSALSADLTKWVGDRTTIMATITADLNKLIADRMQLVTDLSASQN